MKKCLLIISCLCIGLMATAQVSKTIHVATAGKLSTLITSTELQTVTHLTLTGNIDARDVLVLRDYMPVLEVLNIAAVNIMAYTGVATAGNSIYPANEIPQESFYKDYVGKETLKTIILPSTLKSIGGHAFSECDALAGSLILPNSITTIKEDAFRGCTGFEGGLVLPNSLTTIEDHAFGSCSGFTGSLNLPSTLTKIGDNAFYDCNSFVGSLILPNSLTTIGEYAFAHCSGFTGSLTLPNSIFSIGKHAFYGCSGYTGDLVLSNALTKIEDYTFDGCSGFTGTLTLPNSLTTIGEGAFVDCSNITALIIGKNVSNMSDNALKGCSSLVSITVLRTSPPKAYETTFTDVSYPNCKIEVPIGAIPNYQAADYWKLFFNITEINASAVPALGNMRIKVFSTDSNIIIEGSIAGETISLYSINGKQIVSQQSKGERISLPVQKNTVYFVKTLNQTFKVQL